MRSPCAATASPLTAGACDARSDTIKRQLLKTHGSSALELYYQLTFGALSDDCAPAVAAADSSGATGGVTADGGAADGDAGALPAHPATACPCGFASDAAAAPAPTAAGRGSLPRPAGGGASVVESRGPRRVSLQDARENCMYSVAAYAIVQYILGLKDRHNGNIVIDAAGRMVHSGFAFVLGLAPGGITFEKPAFKLTKDIVDVWGGRGSALWDTFVEQVVLGMQAVQANWQPITQNVEIVCASRVRFPFLAAPGASPKTILTQLRRRFKLFKNKAQTRRWVVWMVEYAFDNLWTTTYGKFQLLTNGIVP